MVSIFKNFTEYCVTVCVKNYWMFRKGFYANYGLSNTFYWFCFFS